MATNIVSASEEECTCPVCCEIFTDPVLLLCGHSFCKDCLQEWWKQSTVNKCPVCKEIFPMSQPPRILALRNLSDKLKRDKSQSQSVRPTAEELCSEHGEKLKLFCEDDQQLICVICRDAKKHKKHNCSPVNEAAEAQRNQLTPHLTTLKTKLGSFKKAKVKWDQIFNHITNQAQQTEKTITEEFQKLYQFLRAEETARIDALRQEAKRKSEDMNIRKINLNAEISSLTNKIETIEKEMKTADVTFLLNINSTMKIAKCDLPEPETPSGALIDEAKHVGNLQFTVWNKMKDMIKYTPVILDPNTGGAQITISEDMTRSTRSDRSQVLPENPERLPGWDVFGYGGFTSGKHTWDVELEDVWRVGVVVQQKGKYGLEKFCGILWHGNSTLESTPETSESIIHQHLPPKKMRVHLDYDLGIISFSDLDRKTHIHTIKYKFTERVYPYFDCSVKILPAQLLVRVSLPSQIFCTRSNIMRP